MLEPAPDPDLYSVMSPPDRGTPSNPEPESGPTAFPLFSEAPFLVWCHQHRKSRRLGHIHSTCQPPIRLWDETDDPNHKS